MPDDPALDLAFLAGTAYEPVIHAGQVGRPSLCGDMKEPITGLRYAVTCAACKAEIARRLARRRIDLI